MWRYHLWRMQSLERDREKKNEKKKKQKTAPCTQVSDLKSGTAGLFKVERAEIRQNRATYC